MTAGEKVISKEDNPTNPQEKAKSLLNEGNDLYFGLRYKEAISKLEEANTILPTEEGFYLLGLSYYKIKDFTKSGESLDLALNLNPRSERVLLAKAILETSLGQEENSLEIYTKLVSFYPENQVYNFKKAVSLKSLNRYTEALEEFQKIKEDEFRMKSQLFTHLGELYHAVKNYSLSEKYYSKAKAANPDLPEIDSAKKKVRYSDLFEKGNTLYNQNKQEDAIEYLEEAASISPSSTIYSLLGKSYYSISDYKKAESNFQKSLTFEKNKEVYLYLGKIYSRTGKINLAVQNFIEATKNYSQDADVQNELGLAYKKLACPKLALLAFISAKELNPNSIQFRKNLVFTYLEEGQTLEANREARDLQPLSANDKELKEIFSLLNSTENTPNLNDKLKKWRSKRVLLEGRIYEEQIELEKAEKFYKSKLSDKAFIEPAKYRLSLIYSQKAEEELNKNHLKKAQVYLQKAKEYDLQNWTFSNLEDRLKDSQKRQEANRYYSKAERLSLSNDTSLSIEEYTKSFFKEKTQAKLNKIVSLYLSSNKKSACISFLKKAEIESADNTDLLEGIASAYLKLEQESLAIQLFKKVLERNPESYQSYYRLGLRAMDKDRRASLSYFEKAIALEKKDSNLYIARGINYYKLGNRERAGEDFRYALNLESDLEIASYNLGMILYNDNLTSDAELIFLDLTQKYPDFAEPFYHLSYIYFEKKDFSKAEKFILQSLKLERNVASLFAYIQILNELKTSSQEKDSIQSKIQKLKKEVLENYPTSSYAKRLTSETVPLDDKIVFQNYPLQDTIVSQPIYINQSLIVNYGTSIARIDSQNKMILWKVETPNLYRVLKANSRLYGLTKNSLDQYDLETGKLLWKIPMKPKAIIRFQISDTVIFSEKIGSSETLYSYSMDGEFISSIDLAGGSKWELSANGILFIFHKTNDGLSWEIYNSELKPITDTLTLLGSEKGEIKILGTIEDLCFVLKENYLYRFEANGNFTRSGKLDDKQATIYIYKKSIYIKTDKNLYKTSSNLEHFTKIEGTEKNKSEFLVDNNTYLSSDGILKVKDNSGKILWSENLSSRADKTKSSVYSVYIRE